MRATVVAIEHALRGKNYRYNSEVDLHEGLAQALTEDGIEFEREVKVTGGRIDFLIADVGVEVKIKGSANGLRAQVARYSMDGRISEFLIVTTRPTHRLVSGATRNGKPIRVLTIGGLSL